MDGASGSAKDEIKEAARLMKEENLSLDEALLPDKYNYRNGQ